MTWIVSTLDGLPTPRNFSDLYHDFSVAMLIDSTRPRNGRYSLQEVDFHLDIGTPDGSVLFGGAADLLDNWAIFESTGGGTLTFDTQYQTEELWDFGFVQVSTDGGNSWTSLANGFTTSDHDPSAHPKVIENLPGLTGDSGGWVNMSFDLSAYAGQAILIAFRPVP